MPYFIIRYQDIYCLVDKVTGETLHYSRVKQRLMALAKKRGMAFYDAGEASSVDALMKALAKEEA